MYDECPNGMQQQTVLAKCEGTLMECPGTGTFVSQDPSNNCAFYPCPESSNFGGLGSPSMNSAPPTSEMQPSDIGQLESEDHSTNVDAGSSLIGQICPMDVMECPGEHFQDEIQGF